MSDKELNRYYQLTREIKDLEARIKEIEETGGVSGIQYREVDIQKTPAITSIQDKLGMLMDQYIEKRVSALEECIKIQRYIDDVEDIVIRQIMRYRFIDFKQWNQIDILMHYAEGTSKKKYYRFKK